LKTDKMRNWFMVCSTWINWYTCM